MKREEDQNVNLRMFRRLPASKRGLIAVLAAAVAAATSLAIPAAGTGTAASAAPARAAQVPAEATGLGQLSGILPASKLTLPSAIEVNLSQEYVRLPIYPGSPTPALPIRRRSGTSWRTPPPRAPRTTWA